MRRQVLALLVGMSVVACSYIFELEPSTQTLGVDGSAEGGGAVTDGPDPSVPDVAPRPPPPPFCESRLPNPPALFCADFDDDPAPQVGIVGEPRTISGRVGVVSAVSLSPSRSLSTTVTAAGGTAAVARTLEGTPEAVTASFDMLISTSQATSLELSPIELRTAASSCVIRLVGGATWTVAQSCVLEAGAPSSVATDTGRAVDPRSWHRYAVSVVFLPVKKVTVDIDNVRVVDVAALDAMAPSTTVVTFGLSATAGGGATAFHDNLLVTSP